MGGSARVPYAGASLIALDSPVGPVWSFPDVDQSAIQNGEPVKGRCKKTEHTLEPGGKKPSTQAHEGAGGKNLAHKQAHEGAGVTT